MKILLSLLFFLFFSPIRASALEIPKIPEGYVSDYARLLSPTAKARLENKLQTFEQKTSNQIIVAIFPSLEGEVLEDFSIRLAETWKIGQKEKDNGVILLIFKNDRKVRIEVGYGLEGALPDATSKRIIENEIVPRFREGRFDEGIESGVDAILAAAKGEYQGTPSQTENYFGPAILIGIFLGAFLPLFLLWPIFIFGVFFFVWALIHVSFLGFFYALSLGMTPLPFYYLFGRHRGGHSVLSRRGYYSGGGVFGGGGGFGGGGFSGGGGSFGGGGASGSW